MVLSLPHLNRSQKAQVGPPVKYRLQTSEIKVESRKSNEYTARCEDELSPTGVAGTVRQRITFAKGDPSIVSEPVLKPSSSRDRVFKRMISRAASSTCELFVTSKKAEPVSTDCTTEPLRIRSRRPRDRVLLRMLYRSQIS
mmetsp:Transcript_15775/g.23713  ORF Transcript_15775/g.23713 Transcript_15775/m.23713 type:complete len:141 (+) Transcript_15775:86-508(+)